MTYDELKAIAQPHLREGDNLPSNAFLLLNQLHIPFRSKRQCETDFGTKMTPLYNSPAFLEIDSDGNKVIYFNDSVKYWNFYIFHEIGHYLLGHEADSPQHEMDADMLACILAAPLENLPSGIKSARDLSTLCKIPIDKAEMYWAEIKDNFSVPDTHIKSPWMYAFFGCIGILVLGFAVFFGYVLKSDSGTANSGNTPIISISQHLGETPVNGGENAVSDDSDVRDDAIYYITSSGSRYHAQGCRYILGKDNVISVTASQALSLGKEPCKVCLQ